MPSTSANHSLLEWQAPDRPFRVRSQDYFKTIAAMVFLISVILFFAGELMLIIAVLSVTFVAYALASVPPGETTHRITTHGVEDAGNLHRWEELRDFWFEEPHGQKMLVIHTYLPYPPRIMMLLGATKEEAVKKILIENIPFREKPDKSFVDNVAQWLSEKIPLEKPTA